MLHKFLLNWCFIVHIYIIYILVYISNYYIIQKFKDSVEETTPEIKKEIFTSKRFIMFWGKLYSIIV